MSETKFHKAAKEGYIDLLHEATKHDANKKDEDGMTPTLYAAFHGNLDALRVLISRRGDPDKCDLFGSSALHLVCARGNMDCCTYLVSFGANIFVLDNDFHTPLDVAAMNGHTKVVRFLDDTIARLTQKNPRSVKKKKEEEAIKARDRIKKFDKLAARAQKKAEKEDGYRPGERKNSFGTLTSATHRSTSGDSRTGDRKFSDFTKGRSRGVKGKIDRKQRSTEDFRVTERDASGQRSVRTIQGIKGGEVMFVDRPGNRPPRELSNLFEHEQPASHTEEEMKGHAFVKNRNDASGLFTIPRMGERFFLRNPETNMLGSLPFMQGGDDSRKHTEADNPPSDLPWGADVLDEDSLSSPLQTFLASCQLPQYLAACQAERIELDALMLCTDQDLQAAGIKIGHRRIILDAVQRRQKCLSHPGSMHDLAL